MTGTDRVAPAPGRGKAAAAPAAALDSGMPVDEAPGESQVVVVVGAVPGVGASGLVVGVAGAALSAGLSVRVVDAACPRRSALRELCDTQGHEHPAGPGASVVTSTQGTLVAQHVHGGLDTRIDDPAPWRAGYDQAGLGRAGVTVIDPGVSAEEALTLGTGRTWLTGPVAGDGAWLVLVVTGTTGCLRRTEAALTAWSAAGLLPVAQVVLTGPAPVPGRVRAEAGAGFYTAQALDRATTSAWHPDVYGLAHTGGSLTGPLVGAGRRVLTGMGGRAARAVAAAAGSPRRGLIRRRRSSS